MLRAASPTRLLGDNPGRVAKTVVGQRFFSGGPPDLFRTRRRPRLRAIPLDLAAPRDGAPRRVRALARARGPPAREDGGPATRVSHAPAPVGGFGLLVRGNGNASVPAPAPRVLALAPRPRAHVRAPPALSRRPHHREGRIRGRAGGHARARRPPGRGEVDAFARPGSRRRPPREIRSSSAEGDGSSARASPTKSSARRRPRASPMRRVACEARVLARLGAHPCVISALECFRGERDFAIVFELADRGDARAALDRRRRDGALMDEAEAWATLRPLASALAHAHSLGVAHGDVKPANLLFVNETLKLADFGLATEASEAESPSAATEARRRVGTPRYAAPEVCSPSPGAATEGSAFAADVWSLGCVFHELLTLRAPFDAERAPSRPEVATRARGRARGRPEPLVRHHEREETKMDRRKSREEAASRAAPRGRGTRRFRRFDAARGAAPLGIRSRAGGSAKSLGIWRRRCSRGTRARGRAPKPSRRRASPPRGGSPPPTERPFETRKRRSRTPRAIIERVSRAKRRGRERRFHRGRGKTNAPPPSAPAPPRRSERASRRCANGSPRRRRATTTRTTLVVPRDVGGARRLIDVLDDGARSDDDGARLIRYARVAAFAARALGRADLSDELTERVDEEGAATRRRVRGGAPTDTLRRVVSAPSPPSSAPASLARVARGEPSRFRSCARAVTRAFEALGVDTRFASARTVARARGWAADAALRDACEKALARRRRAFGPRERRGRGRVAGVWVTRGETGSGAGISAAAVRAPP